MGAGTEVVIILFKDVMPAADEGRAFCATSFTSTRVMTSFTDHGALEYFVSPTFTAKIHVGDPGDEDVPFREVDSDWNQAGTLDGVGGSFGLTAYTGSKRPERFVALLVEENQLRPVYLCDCYHHHGFHGSHQLICRLYDNPRTDLSSLFPSSSGAHWNS